MGSVPPFSSPFSFPAVGSYRIRVEKKDYMPVTQEIIINDGETTELNIKLKKSD
jgi:hypothetical protein